MVLILDNYDSFSYNLYQYVGTLEPYVRIVRSDKIDVAGIRALAPDRLILSPGPGYPKDAGVCLAALRELGGAVPVLGVCLGHQSIGEAYGGRVVPAPRLMHGKKSRVALDVSCPLFAGLPETIDAARYHSLVVEKKTLPACLRVTATDPDGEVMALAHRSRPVYGVQFHPESVLTPRGMEIIRNFLSIKKSA